MTEDDEDTQLYKESDALADRIETPEDFYNFLDAFAREIPDDEEYRGLPFSEGIEGMATFLYKNEDMPQQPDWKLFAEILIRGMHHA